MRVADGKARFSFFLAGGLLTILAPLTIAIFGFSGLTFVISTILMVTGGAFAGEAIMKLWTQLQFPTLLRTTAQGTILAAARLLAAAFAVITPALVAISPRLLFGILAVVCTLGVGIAAAAFRTRDQYSEFDQVEETVAQ